MFKSLVLNTVSLVSVYFFDWLLLPLAQAQQRWFHRNLGWFYQVLWLLPVVGASFYLNVSLSPLPSPPTRPVRPFDRVSAYMMHKSSVSSRMDTGLCPM